VVNPLTQTIPRNATEDEVSASDSETGDSATRTGSEEADDVSRIVQKQHHL
jgi:hypothetical protein